MGLINSWSWSAASGALIAPRQRGGRGGEWRKSLGCSFFFEYEGGVGGGSGGVPGRFELKGSAAVD